MPRQVDLAVVTQDPRFGGGARSQTEAFWHGSRLLGRQPQLLYLSRGRATSVVRRTVALRSRPEQSGELQARSFPSFLPELDAWNQASGGLRMAQAAASARTLWVVAAAASYGWAAVRSGRPYACWVGTALEEEWASRRSGLPRSRRLALRLNEPVLTRLERRVLRGAASLYATSAASRTALARAAGLPSERVRVLPIPVDLERFRPAPEQAWLATIAEPVLVFVGRASDPRKNVKLLLAAFEDVRRELPSSRLRLVGEPPPRGVRLPARVEAAGEVASVAGALVDATLFVLPSLQEGFGIVAAEALAAGLPAVVTPSGGPEELVSHSGGGIVLDGFSPDALAGRLVELLRQPDRLLEMRRRGREYVEREHSPARFRELLGPALQELDERA